MRIFRSSKKTPGTDAVALASTPVEAEARTDADAVSLWDRPHGETTLADGRRALARCTASLDWTRGAAAAEIALHIDETLTDFPELEFEYQRSTLASRALAEIKSPLRAAAIAHILAPDDASILGMLLIALARAHNWNALHGKLERYKPGENIDSMIARLAFELSYAVDYPDALVAIEGLSVRLTDGRSLAALRLGDALTRMISSSQDSGEEAMALAGSIARSRNLAQRYGAATRDVGSKRVRMSRVANPDRTSRLARMLDARLPRRRSADDSQPHKSKSQAGIVSWTAVANEAFGYIAVPASKFKSNYASHNDGTLSAKIHCPETPFIFGPYISLPDGFYKVSFLGDVDEGLRYELAATTSYGANKLAIDVITDSTRHDTVGVLGELHFYVSNEPQTLEFVIRPLTFYGSLTFRGVKVVNLF